MSSNYKEFGSHEVCLMACLAHYMSIQVKSISRRHIDDFFNLLPSNCRRVNPYDHKALNHKKGDVSIENANYSNKKYNKYNCAYNSIFFFIDLISFNLQLILALTSSSQSDDDMRILLFIFA